jgi:hypothetical protein
MSDKELTRLEVLRDLTSGRLTPSAATELLGLERRQVQRWSCPGWWCSSVLAEPLAKRALHMAL